MKLLLLHGPAKVASRKKLIELKQGFDPLRREASQNNVIVFDAGSDLEAVLGSIGTSSLFSDQQLIILENPPEDFNCTLYPVPGTLALWFDHEINSKKPIFDFVKKSKGEIIFFPEDKEISVFPFLDYLAVRSRKAYLEMEKLKNAGFDMQYFMTMVFYLLRNLVTTPKNAPQFVKDKLSRQRKNFSLEQITYLYKEIIEIDFKIKSGLLEKSQAEFLLVNLF